MFLVKKKLAETMCGDVLPNLGTSVADPSMKSAYLISMLISVRLSQYTLLYNQLYCTIPYQIIIVLDQTIHQAETAVTKQCTVTTCIAWVH